MMHAVRTRPWLGYVVVAVVLAVLRLCWLDAYPLNSDEAQHAHVAWAWTRRLLPYRDVFDNHGPLFGLLYSLALQLIGERLHVLTWLRLAVQPWYALSLASVWWLGRRLYGSRVALAAVLVAGLFPRFFLVSGQFRTDDMWAALWLAALAVVVGAPSRPWRWLLAGALAGAALCVSQKTLLLLASALVAALLTQRHRPVRLSRATVCCAMAGVAGLLLVPATMALWLHQRHDLAAAWYGLAGYNLAAAGAAAPGGGNSACFKLPLLALLLALCTRATLGWLRRNHDPAKGATAFLMLQSLLFLLVVFLAWPLVSRQDPLPALPTLILAVGGIVARQSHVVLSMRQKLGLLAAVVAIELCLLVVGAPPWVDELAGQRAQLAAVLRYTNDDDTVMDAKSGAIFRMRPYYPVIESLALRRFRNGLTADDISGQLVRHGTMLVIRGRLPPSSDAFVQRNYLPAGDDIWIAGRRLPAGAQQVRIELPGDYALVDGARLVTASIDGQPAAQHWRLLPGLHRLAVTTATPLYLVWTQAWRRGWRPIASALR